ncbi:Serine/threonine-protein kinase pkn1 [Colletotrichum siamense]|nr:Serine/threonine-protein kinase pkn1 [Colletotrichum siamense]
MADPFSDTLKSLRSKGIAFGSEPLLTRPDGTVVDLANGYIPLLANFTFEDKAAKGLRKRRVGDEREVPVYFSAVELVRDNRILLLTGPSGSGKTTFAKYVSYRMATDGFRESRSVTRNELGDLHDEKWETVKLEPYYFLVGGTESLRTLVERTLPKLLTQHANQKTGFQIIIDGVDEAGSKGVELLGSITALVKSANDVRLLLLGDTKVCSCWVLPSVVVRHDILPFLIAQRKRAAHELLIQEGIGLGSSASNPAFFALALQAGCVAEQAEDILDEWIKVVGSYGTSAEYLLSKAYEEALRIKRVDQRSTLALPTSLLTPAWSCSAVQQLLAARQLATLPTEEVLHFYYANPGSSQPVIRSCLVRLAGSAKAETLLERLLDGASPESHRAALLIADLVPKDSQFEQSVAKLVLEVVDRGLLTPKEREKAGRILSSLGDPRNLTGLAQIPAGTFVMGSESHPNSQPPNSISLGSFRIGIYPVVNRDYSAFARGTGRDWLSPDGTDPERLNAPATDLTWHDARAYCRWLTERWRASGEITPNNEVRLPTEPEWERASRGDQSEAGSEGLVYPWGTEWETDAANSEEAGFNNTCAVGLFPKGRSPYGCYDMAGQVWEWCTTLWGEHMASPSFKYPWKNDEREALQGPETIRRALRGGCFSSPKVKANCTYRGSLEPAGFWRGNGFRIVVAPNSAQ